VIGSHAVTLDITEPLQPRIMSDQLLPTENNNSWAFDGSGQVMLSLPPVTGLPARQRLEALVDHPWWPLWRMDGMFFAPCPHRGSNDNCSPIA